VKHFPAKNYPAKNFPGEEISQGRIIRRRIIRAKKAPPPIMGKLAVCRVVSKVDIWNLSARLLSQSVPDLVRLNARLVDSSLKQHH
jgi:hypothetical protein